MITDDTIRKIKEKYKSGMRIQLEFMDDKQSPPKGTKGTISYVDDIGTIFVKWDNGCCLGLIVGTDKFFEIKESEK